MLIQLSDYCRFPGRNYEESFKYERNEIEIGGITYPVVKNNEVSFDISCPRQGKVTVKGDYSLTVAAECDRCLKPLEITVDVSIDREYVVSEEPGGKNRAKESDDSLTEYEDCEYCTELDTDELIYREMLMEWPMKLLCREECKGLCLKCGRDLNDSECGCDRTVLDPRMAAILDVFNNA